MNATVQSKPADGNNPAVAYRVSAGVGYVCLNRPDRLNVLNREMALELVSAFDTAANDDAVKVIVICGEGRAFCAGGDLAHFLDYGDNTDAAVDDLLPQLHGLIEKMQESAKIIVFAVHGFAAGAGMSLAFMGDFCVAAEDAVFVPAYAEIGLTPDCGGTIGLVRAVGSRRALQLWLSQDGITAEAALATGLVTKIVSSKGFRNEVRTFCEQLASLDDEVLFGTKKLVKNAQDTAVAEQLESEMHHLKGCMKSDTFRNTIKRMGRD